MVPDLICSEQSDPLSIDTDQADILIQQVPGRIASNVWKGYEENPAATMQLELRVGECGGDTRF